MNRQRLFLPAAAALSLTLLFTMLSHGTVNAQTVTGTIRGHVVNETKAPVSTATVTLKNPLTGVSRTTITTKEGVYVLAGVQPGTYDLTVTMMGYNAPAQTVRVLIGQSLTMDVQMSPQVMELQGINAVGTRALETKTSEVATNVTTEQIEALPQGDRNFLNFAGLAPGITLGREETNKVITAGGLPSNKINVFIDGASFKNDMLEGGVHGQDASRGNPFPQNALQEFRVITQNFKAEYQRAASAIITASTKSGTNDLTFDGFVLGQNKGLVELNPGVALNCADTKAATCPKPEYQRTQVGFSVGGPIIKDKAHFFAAFEGNYQNAQSIVAPGNASVFGNSTLVNGRTPNSYAGTFDQPFRSNLGVAKLSYIPAANQTLDVSWNGRFESDKRGFGGSTSFESAENVAIKYNVLTVQHSMTKGDWLNQVNVSGQRSTWNPTVVDASQDVGFNYDGVIRVGARDSEQKFQQDRLAFRNDLSRFNVAWNGDHVFKMGANVDFLNYKLQKRFNGNPLYTFVPATSLTVPVRAVYGVGDAGMSEGNVQFGLYAQDDWDVTNKLQLNLGVRWDAETNQFNNNWITPDSIRSRFAGRGYESRFTDGSQRPMFLGGIQPRTGFSYDVKGDSRTVLHGGWGLYYDREVWNHMIDERFRLQWAVRTFEFTSTGAPGKIPFQESYLTRAGLDAIVASANPNGPTSEVFLLSNDTKPPRSQQYSFGLRQVVGNGIALGAQFRGVRGEHLLSWYCGLPNSVHGYCTGGRDAGLPYDPVLSSDEGASRYSALDLTIDKPYTATSKWGVTVSYTMADAKRKGADFFTLDFPIGDTFEGQVINSPADWPFVDAAVEKHHVTASAIVGLPAQIRLSSVVQLGSGVRYSVRDETAGWGPRRVAVDFNSQTGDTFQQMDLRLEKKVSLPGRSDIGIMVEAINVFNHANYRNYEELKAFEGGGQNNNFGKSQWWSADQGRRIQLGLNFGSH